MKKELLSILVEDSLELHQINLNENSINAIVEYLDSESYRALVRVDEEIMFLTRTEKDISGKMYIGESTADSYVECNSIIDHGINEFESPLIAAFQTKIPLSRIMNDYESLSDLNEKYIDSLTEFFDSHINKLIRKLTDHDPSAINEEVEYKNTIREFIKNELK